MAGPDDLLLLLVQHWAWDDHVFPTEDDRHDVATLLLFQSYTGGRPAEFVHSSKGKASEDPLGEAEETCKNGRPRGREDSLEDEDDEVVDANDGLEYHDDSDAADDPQYDDDLIFDSDDSDDDGDGGNADDDNDLHDKGTDKSAGRDSGYSSDRTDAISMEDSNDCYPMEVDEAGWAVQQDCSVAELDELEEATRKYKALCYEDICIWIVKNPKQGARDVLAMEVHLRHHKGVDNKPKPYVLLSGVHSQANSHL